MKKIFLSTITIVTLFTFNAHALNINKAVSLALENNNLLKEYSYKIEEKKHSLNSSKSTYKPKLDIDYSYDTKNNPNGSEDKHDSSFNAVLNFNLFNGFKNMYEIKSAKNSFDLSKFEYKANKQDVILLTKQNYLQYLKNAKNTKVQEKAVKNLEKQYFDAKNFFDQGINITLNSLLEVKITLLQAKQLHLKAISLEKISKKTLFNTMGIEINENIEDVKVETTAFLLDDEYNKNILENRSELKVLQKYKDSLINSQKSLKGNYYPKIDALLEHKEYGNKISLNEKGGSDKAQNIATFTASWNLYNGSADKSSILINKQQINQVSAQIEELKQDINLQYENAKEQYSLSIKSLDISKEALKQSEVNYEIVESSFKEGVVTSKDLLDANYLLTQGLANYYDSSYDLILSKATLLRVLEIDK